MRCLVFVLTLFTVNVYAQSEEAAVKGAINAFFTGMRQSDSGLIKAVLAPDAILQTVVRGKDSSVAVHTEDLQKFVTAITQPHPEIYDERVTFGTVRIDADLAVAWTPYKFYLGEKFSHCGVNSFQLVRLKGRWKIQYIIDTRRKEDCP